MKRTVNIAAALVFVGAGQCVAGDTTEIWTKVYNSGQDHQFTIPWNGNPTTNGDYPSDAAIDSKGNIIVVGYRAGVTAHAYNGYAQKYDRRGTLVCSIELDAGLISGSEASSPGGYSTDSFTSVAVDSQDNIILGASKAGNYYIQGYWQEAWLRKYDRNCQPVWANPVEYSGQPDFLDSAWNNVNDIAVDASDNIYVAGATFAGWGNGEGRWFVFKYSASGVQDTTFKVFYDSFPSYYLNEAAYGVAVDSSGNVIVVGRKGISGVAGGLTNDFDWHVRKYGPTGTLLWQDTLAHSAHLFDLAWSVKVDSNDDVIVAGYANFGTDNSTNANNNWMVAKYGRDGSGGNGVRLWAAPYIFEGPDHKNDYLYNGLAIGRDNNIWVGGVTTDASNINHRRIALLDSATGAELLSQTWSTNTQHETIHGLAFKKDALIAVGGVYNGTYWDWSVTPISTVNFNDTVPTSWAIDYIRSIYFDGITTGCSQVPLNYCPTGEVTRAQMAAFIVRAVEGEPATSCTAPPFNDVGAGDFFCKYIQRMSALGITTGCGGGSYCPNDLVTREQMAAFLVRAIEGEPATSCTAPPFNDVGAGDFFCKYIQRMSALGITTGCGGGSYCPANKVTREQMGAFLGRAFLKMH